MKDSLSWIRIPLCCLLWLAAHASNPDPGSVLALESYGQGEAPVLSHFRVFTGPRGKETTELITTNQCGKTDDVASVRCCTANHKVVDSTKTGCLAKANYEAAESFCAEKGYKLCTQAELRGKLNDGCPEDYVWSSTICAEIGQTWSEHPSDSTPKVTVLKDASGPTPKAKVSEHPPDSTPKATVKQHSAPKSQAKSPDTMQSPAKIASEPESTAHPAVAVVGLAGFEAMAPLHVPHVDSAVGETPIIQPYVQKSMSRSVSLSSSFLVGLGIYAL